MRVVAKTALIACVLSVWLSRAAAVAVPKRTAPVTTPASAPAGPAASTDKNAYPVFPNADAGADPSVPAEQGGKGFTGEGWETNTDFDLIGDPRAVKGGVFRDVHARVSRARCGSTARSQHVLNYMISDAGLRDAARPAPDDA